jgi:hypothetical protein
MVNRRYVGGQSLVEFSLVFPVMMLMVLLMLEFLFIVRTKLVLGFTADRIARAAAAQGHPRMVEAHEFATHFAVGPNWGVPLPARVSEENLAQWPAYSGLAIVKPLHSSGRLSIVDMSFIVVPKMWFTDLIHVPNLGAHVELPEEPEVPQL